MIVVNFKTYEEASGEKAVSLALICKKVSEETGVRVVVVPQNIDMDACLSTGVECWSQHVDFELPGKHTGQSSLYNLRGHGVAGSLLNHSENKVSISDYDFSLFQGHKNFLVCVCVADESEARDVLEVFTPDYLAYEPTELIGSKEKSVASEKPETISNVVKIAGAVPVLVGAGVHSIEDVKTSLDLGAKGVLVATDVVLSKDPEVELTKLVRGFNMA